MELQPLEVITDITGKEKGTVSLLYSQDTDDKEKWPHPPIPNPKPLRTKLRNLKVQLQVERTSLLDICCVRV